MFVIFYTFFVSYKTPTGPEDGLTIPKSVIPVILLLCTKKLIFYTFVNTGAPRV